MSHFTVLVIGEDVEAKLAPFHEFECTGVDEFVQNIDKTEEYRKEFEESKTTMVVDPDGNKYEPYDDMFYRDLTDEEEKNKTDLKLYTKDWGDGKGRRDKIQFLPEGWEKKEFFRKDLETFAKWCEDYHGLETISELQEPDLKGKQKYGWCRVNEQGEVIEIIDRTNPNAQWDWYQVGGRWSGFFKLKEGKTGEAGEQSLIAKMQGAEGCKEGEADSALKGDIDFEGMRNQAQAEAEAAYDRLERLIGEILPLEFTWSSLWEGEYKDMPRPEKQEKYHAQPMLQKIKEAKKSEDLSQEDRRFLAWIDYENYMVGRDRFVQSKRNAAISTFAVLKDGQWYEEGDMGWWGCVSNKKDQEKWNEEFAKLLEELPDDTRLTVVDCHI